MATTSLWLIPVFLPVPQSGGGAAGGGRGRRGGGVPGCCGGVRRGRLHLGVSEADPVTTCRGFSRSIGRYGAVDLLVSHKL